MVSVPQHFDADHCPNSEARRIILALLNQNGGVFEGKTRLYKAFYTAHLYYWKRHGKYLSDHPIVCMPEGPGIDKGAAILDSLAESGLVRIRRQPIGPYEQDVYELEVSSDSLPQLSEDEENAISAALSWVSDKSATQLSQWTHERSATWIDAWTSRRCGEELHFALDTVSPHRREQLDSAHAELSKYFG